MATKKPAKTEAAKEQPKPEVKSVEHKLVGPTRIQYVGASSIMLNHSSGYTRDICFCCTGEVQTLEREDAQKLLTTYPDIFEQVKQ